MKLSFAVSSIAAAALMTFTAACDSTSEIGSSLANNKVSIVIDSAFTVAGHSEAVEAIRPKTSTQLIGRIDIPDYGTMSSSVVAQFLPSTQLDTANFAPADVDSLILTLRYAYQAFMGDSVAPMGVRVFALDKQLPSQIASDFDPTGYYDPSAPLATTIYNATSMGSDSIAKLGYRDIRLKMPRELGRSLFQSFVDNPATYANGQIFARDIFPGIYLENSFGAGRLTRVSQTTMSMYMRHIEYNDEEEKLDTLDAVHQYFMVTPEVINNNNLEIDLAESVTSKITEGQTMLVAPAGYEVDFEFPVGDIISRFRRDDNGLAVVNGLTFSIPADSLVNDYGVQAPPYALLVLKKDRETFFNENKLPDNKTSFYTSYNKSTQSYDFSSMRSYLIEMLDKETLTPEDYTFSLIPVQANFETQASSSYYYYGTTQQILTEILPYLESPVVAEVKLDKAKIKFTYSLQSKK